MLYFGCAISPKGPCVKSSVSMPQCCGERWNQFYKTWDVFLKHISSVIFPPQTSIFSPSVTSSPLQSVLPMFQTSLYTTFPLPTALELSFPSKLGLKNTDSGLLYTAGFLEYPDLLFTIHARLYVPHVFSWKLPDFWIAESKGQSWSVLLPTSGSSVEPSLPSIHCSESTRYPSLFLWEPSWS